MTKKNEKPAGIPIDARNWDTLRYLRRGKTEAARAIGKLLDDKIIVTRRRGQSMNENLAPASELLAEVRALNDVLQRSSLNSWRAHVTAYPPSPEAIALLVFVGHEELLKEQATAGAKKRHAPTRDAMELVHAWWFKNGEGKMTKDDAADAIVAANLVSEKRSAIRKWLYPEPLEAARTRLASASSR